MSTRTHGSASWGACALALAVACALVPSAQQPQGRSQVSVTGAGSVLVQEGLATAAPSQWEAAGYERVPAPGVQFVPNVARATNVPWIATNWWRYQRGLRKANYDTLPAGSAALAAAEAYAQDVDAILNPDPTDTDDLRNMLQFLKAHDRPPMPSLANIGVVDQPLPEMDEVLNMFTRRNLLYRVVKTPDPALDMNIQLGTKDFPTEAAANPYEFALLVRTKLGDDTRLVRLYGTNTVLARLTAGRGRARLFLLQFTRGRRPAVTDSPQALQVRLLGDYQPTAFAGYGSPPGAKLTDIQHPAGATEFWVPDFSVFAIIDLDGPK